MIITKHPFYIKTKNKRFKGHVYNHITITKKTSLKLREPPLSLISRTSLKEF